MFKVAGGEIVLWAEDGGPIMLKAAEPHGDAVELAEHEARELVDALQELLGPVARVEPGKVGAPSLVRDLQKLLVTLSDGEWEHGHAIAIRSIDNPGWSVDISLNGTPHEKLSVGEIAHDRSDDDWLVIRTETRGFETYLMAACGPENLEESLEQMLLLLVRPPDAFPV